MNWKFWVKKAPAKEPELPPAPDLADPKWSAIAAFFTPGRQFTHLGELHVVMRLQKGIITTEYPSCLGARPPEKRDWAAGDYDYLLSKIPKGDPHA